VFAVALASITIVGAWAFDSSSLFIPKIHPENPSRKSIPKIHPENALIVIFNWVALPSATTFA
jgi:hypothetical protein